MASRFPGSTGAIVAVVVEIDGKTGPGCWAHFPGPNGRAYPGVRFDATDTFEPTFARLDAAGVRVWLQVEPAGCDMAMLIDLVMRQYGHHPSVVGFGVDDEWYLNATYPSGKPITDAEARDWVARTRSHNADNLVFLKHWLTTQMPPTYRDGLVFIDDGQEFTSQRAMLAEFSAWGAHFAPSPVGFQFGYESDREWWEKLSPDAPTMIGDALLASVPNTTDLYWVDFSARTIWP